MVEAKQLMSKGNEFKFKSNSFLSRRGELAVSIEDMQFLAV